MLAATPTTACPPVGIDATRAASTHCTVAKGATFSVVAGTQVALLSGAVAEETAPGASHWVVVAVGSGGEGTVASAPPVVHVEVAKDVAYRGVEPPVRGQRL